MKSVVAVATVVAAVLIVMVIIVDTSIIFWLIHSDGKVMRSVYPTFTFGHISLTKMSLSGQVK